MVVAGARGFAKEILEILHRDYNYEEVVFYDDVNPGLPESFYDKFEILKSQTDLKKLVKIHPEFVLGIGIPISRYKLYKRFTNLGGTAKSIISKSATIGSFEITIEDGCTIMDQVLISNNVKIGLGCLVNAFTFVGHDGRIGKFADIGPRTTISGNCTIGDFVSIGTATTILPKVTIGNNVIIGAGSIVKNNLPDNSLVIGAPAKVIKKLPELQLD